MRSGHPVTVLSAVLCFLGLGVARANDKKQPAPRFHAKTTDGVNYTNDSIKGKVVLLEFWTTWCPYRAHEAHFVDQVAKESADKGLITLAINVGESKKLVKNHLEHHPRSVPIVLMENSNLAAMYQANSYPIYVLIDRDGNIAGEQRGAAGEMALRRFLSRVGLGSDGDEAARHSHIPRVARPPDPRPLLIPVIRRSVFCGEGSQPRRLGDRRDA